MRDSSALDKKIFLRTSTKKPKSPSWENKFEGKMETMVRKRRKR
jgi:hypothetical protein